MSTRKRRVEQPQGAMPEHKHCPVCQKAIPTRLQFCSPSCEEADQKRRRSEERVRLVFYVVLIIVMLMLFVSSLGGIPGLG